MASARSGRGLVVILIGVFLLSGCGRRGEAKAEVKRIGPERLAQSVEGLRAPGEEVYGRKVIPETEWPETLKALRPETVSLAPEGIYVKLQSAFAGESGLFIAFAGTSVPTRSGTDPSYERLEGRVYWYRIKG